LQRCTTRRWFPRPLPSPAFFDPFSKKDFLSLFALQKRRRKEGGGFFLCCHLFFLFPSFLFPSSLLFAGSNEQARSAQKVCFPSCGSSLLRMGFPGPKCALCCTIFSIWGVLTLLALGGLWDAKYRKLDPTYQIPDDKMGTAAQSAFIGAAIYLAFIVGCGGRYWWLQRAMRSKKRMRFED
jgi:ribonuclease kappa